MGNTLVKTLDPKVITHSVAFYAVVDIRVLALNRALAASCRSPFCW